jgi:hypothetical protein
LPRCNEARVRRKSQQTVEHTSGFRFTPQRQQVYLVLLQKRDHPTAEEVFIRAKRQMPDISHAWSGRNTSTAFDGRRGRFRAAGLNEDIIRLISAKKNEPEFMLNGG